MELVKETGHELLASLSRLRRIVENSGVHEHTLAVILPLLEDWRVADMPALAGRIEALEEVRDEVTAARAGREVVCGGRAEASATIWLLRVAKDIRARLGREDWRRQPSEGAFSVLCEQLERLLDLDHERIRIQLDIEFAADAAKRRNMRPRTSAASHHPPAGSDILPPQQVVESASGPETQVGRRAAGPASQMAGLPVVQRQAVERIAEVLYHFLPGSGAKYTWSHAAAEHGLERFWDEELAKKPAIIRLLTLTLQQVPASFRGLLITAVSEGSGYRKRKGKLLTREEIATLNHFLVCGGFEISELTAPVFLDTLPLKRQALLPSMPERPGPAVSRAAPSMPTTSTEPSESPGPEAEEQSWGGPTFAPKAARRGATMGTDPDPYTLGQLIAELEGGDEVHQLNLHNADRIEARDGPHAAYGYRMCVAAVQWQPDPDRMPGIDRIELLCDEYGTGLKAENVRKLRGKMCGKLGVGISEANAMTLVAVADAIAPRPAGPTHAANPANDLPPYTPEEQPWFTPLPTPREFRSEELTALADEIDLVIITATDPEMEAVLRVLKPYPRRRAVLKGFAEQETYYLGQFGSCLAAVTRCRMGSLDSGSATLATQHAKRVWRPRAVVMVGIALGKDPAKQKIADVLVASQIISYEPQRVGQTQTVHRGPVTPSNPTLLNRFEVVPHWAFARPDGSRCGRHVGPVLSGEKLIDDPAFKASLFDAYPQAIGGEMEGVGLAAAAVRENLPWILVKAICDWADGTKHGKHQPLAAASAVSLVHHVLSQPDVLHGLAKPTIG